MNRSRLLFLLASGIFVLSILSGTLLGASPGDGRGKDSIYKYLSVFAEVLRLIDQAYVDETDVGDLMEDALDGTPDALDPFSMYVPEQRVQSYLEARAVGSRRSGLRIVKERGVAYVVAVQENGPAADIKLHRGDIVASIDGQSTRQLPLWRIEEILAGPPGTEVELHILRAGESRDLVLQLAEFEPAVAHLEEASGVPVLRIAGFSPATASRVRSLLAAVEGEDLLVDVRGVAWGDPESAYEVADLFASGELGHLVDQAGPVRTFTSSSQRDWSGNLLVLVDRGTQGAGEVFARILQQRARGRLVGQKTFGHAGRSRIVELDAGGSLVITDGFYTGPDGVPMDEGVEPDVAVGDRSRSFAELEESLEDLTLRRALELVADSEQKLDEAA